MGVRINNVILVASAREMTEEAHTKARKIFKNYRHLVGKVCHSMNFLSSFTIHPDGSNEGWKESDEMDKLRAKFCKWLNKNDIDFIEVAFNEELAEII